MQQHEPRERRPETGAMAEGATGPLLLGLDGGGSKTAVWLGRLDDRQALEVLGRATGGASNPQSVGFAAAEANLLGTIAQARERAGLAANALCDAACLAVAGTGRDAERQWLEDLVRRHRVARRCRVVHDALPVLAAVASEPVWGVALIAGTGSLAYGCDPSGRSARAGGWGFVFGDEGSGYWVAVEGLRAAARAADRRGPSTILAELLPQRLGAAAPEGLVPAIYAPTTGRAAVAGLAEVVFDAAASGDAIAADIVRRAAEELAMMVAAVARELRINSRPFPLGIAGGALLGSELLRAQLAEHLGAHRLRAAPLTPVPDPVAGALQLAAHAWQEPRVSQ